MGRKKGEGYAFENVKPGETSRAISHLRKVAALGTPFDLDNDVEGVAQRIEEYFIICEQDDVRPSIAELALAFGMSRRDLYRWRKGERGKNPVVRNLLNQAVNVLEALMEQYMMTGMVNPVSGIFLMRNNYGYRNEDVPTPEETDAPKLPESDIKKLAEKYLADVPKEDE